MIPYTVISIQPRSLAPKLQRVLAPNPQAIMLHYQGDVYYIINGHPTLEGEQGHESFLEVITING